MARKLEQVKNETKHHADEPLAVSSMSNFAGFDPEVALSDVDKIIGLADDASEMQQPVKDEKARIKAERGYNMKGFSFGIQLRRADLLEARDMWMTVRAIAEAMGLDQPDLVDLMQGA